MKSSFKLVVLKLCVAAQSVRREISKSVPRNFLKNIRPLLRNLFLVDTTF